MKNFCYNINNVCAKSGICEALEQTVNKDSIPVIVCIGTDAVIGDSLGPVIGSVLKKRLCGKVYIYGTLDCPITAKEINSVANYISLVHPYSPILAIDAAIGKKEEIGLIKIADRGVKPGLGADKILRSVGDISILGIVSYRTDGNYAFMKNTRLSLVYEMADIISEGVARYFSVKGELPYENTAEL